MKRVFALLFTIVFIILSIISFNPSARADNGSSEDQGLYTTIPYVPEYSGNLRFRKNNEVFAGMDCIGRCLGMS